MRSYLMLQENRHLLCYQKKRKKISFVCRCPVFKQTSHGNRLVGQALVSGASPRTHSFQKKPKIPLDISAP